MAKRKKSKPKTIPAMIITEGRRKIIESLAEALAEIAPSTSRYKNSFCVHRVALQKGLSNCWKKQSNKKKDMAYLLENTIRKYPRKPKALVFAIFEGGVQWMAKKGEQVTERHIRAIAEPMEELGFSVLKELKKIEIPVPSKVNEPTQDIIAMIDRLGLHPALKDDCLQKFKDGHLKEAVRQALERFEKYIQDIVSDYHAHGQKLMIKAFDVNGPIIKLNDLKTANDRSEQKGFCSLTVGAMSNMRNLYSHGDIDQISPIDAFERLCFVSLLFKRVEQAIK